MTSARSALSLTEVASGVFFARGPSVNWVVLTEGGGVTLIDTGYPRNWRRAAGTRPPSR